MDKSEAVYNYWKIHSNRLLKLYLHHVECGATNKDVHALGKETVKKNV